MTTRFAPSPTGLLHLGHAYSAMTAFTHAREGRRTILSCGLRTSTWSAAISNLKKPSSATSSGWASIGRMELSGNRKEAKPTSRPLAQLSERGVLYPCFCSRKEIQEELADLTSAPHQQHPIYPGTCRALSISEREKQLRSGRPYALRLDTETALKLLPREATSWRETDATVFQIEAVPPRRRNHRQKRPGNKLPPRCGH